MVFLRLCGGRFADRGKMCEDLLLAFILPGYTNKFRKTYLTKIHSTLWPLHVFVKLCSCNLTNPLQSQYDHQQACQANPSKFPLFSLDTSANDTL